jgi:flagellar protein FliO/FliZ
MTQLVLGLIIVLFCIVALAWLAKRFNRLQSTPDGSLQVLGGMSMGARERIVLVQVGTKQLLLGVAPGQINTLHVLDEPLEAFSDVHPRMPGQGFAEKLSAAISRKGSR